jgi:hypothetical protein
VAKTTAFQDSVLKFWNTILDNVGAILTYTLVTLALVVAAFVVLSIEQGPIKYGAYLLLVLAFGQVLRGYVELFGNKQVLRDTLIAIMGSAFGIACVGFSDRSNSLDTSYYLVASLFGLLITHMLLFISDKQQGVPPFSVLGKLVYGGFSTIYALYLAYDTKYLKIAAGQCRGAPDYIKGALGVFLETFRT